MSLVRRNMLTIISFFYQHSDKLTSLKYVKTATLMIASCELQHVLHFSSLQLSNFGEL